MASCHRWGLSICFWIVSMFPTEQLNTISFQCHSFAGYQGHSFQLRAPIDPSFLNHTSVIRSWTNRHYQKLRQTSIFFFICYSTWQICRIWQLRSCYVQDFYFVNPSCQLIGLLVKHNFFSWNCDEEELRPIVRDRSSFPYPHHDWIVQNDWLTNFCYYNKICLNETWVPLLAIHSMIDCFIVSTYMPTNKIEWGLRLLLGWRSLCFKSYKQYVAGQARIAPLFESSLICNNSIFCSI